MARVSPRWEDARTVAGFVNGQPNAMLIEFARRFVSGSSAPRCLDLGCGAGRNAIPLADLGFDVTATDLSQPMVDAACGRVRAHVPAPLVRLAIAPMAPLPFPSATFDLVVAHGIWNLARSGAEFRAAVREAARVARQGAGLFLFTFSRHTLPDEAQPDRGESFVFSCWNGEPLCFLREPEIAEELAQAGFTRSGAGPLTEYNRPAPGAIRTGGPPVIYEGTFVRAGSRPASNH